MAVEPLDDAIASIRTALSGLSGDLRASVAQWFDVFAADLDYEQALTLAKQDLPDIINTYVTAVSDFSVQWYADLAPDEPYKPELPTGAIIPPERINKTLEWAVHTGAKGEPMAGEAMKLTLDKLAGSMDRMLHDAQRRTVSYNVEQEGGVKFLRVAQPTACPWCRFMAGKGAVYTSAETATGGHDSCHCIAVPERGDTTYALPSYYKEWQDEYAQIAKELDAEGKPTTLNNILDKMKANDKAKEEAVAAAKAAEEKAAVKKAAKAKAQAKYIAKKKAEKATAVKSWLSAEAEHKSNVSKWLVAEAQHKEAEAKAISKKAAKAAAQAKYYAKKKAEKEAAKAAEQTPQTNLGPVPTEEVFGPAPDPNTFTPAGEHLGSHGAQTYFDADGNKWLVKPQSEFHNLLDEGTAKLQAKAGLTTPATYTLPVAGQMSSVQKWVAGAKSLEGTPIANLTADKVLTLQKHQALDWLISNHDSHASNFLIADGGHVIGIDKGQAFKWFGKDKLNWTFHPNSQAHPPIYNALWKQWIDGDVTTMFDPTEGDYGAFLKHLQSIPDDEVKAMFRPYAEAAAAKGKLVIDNSAPGLSKAPGVPPNDVEAFLNGIVARKNNLVNDFDALYKKAYEAKHAAPVPTNITVPPPATTAQPTVTALTSDVEKALVSQQADALLNAKLYQIEHGNNSGNTAYQQFSVLKNMSSSEFAASVLYTPATKQAVAPAAQALEAELLTSAAKAVAYWKAHPTNGITPNHALTAYSYLKKLTPSQFAANFPKKVEAFKNAPPQLDPHGLDAFFASFDSPSTAKGAQELAVSEQKLKHLEWMSSNKGSDPADSPYYGQLVHLQNQNASQFATEYLGGGVPGSGNAANWVNAVGKYETEPGPSPLFAKFKSLSSAEKKKLGKALASAKYNAKKKGDTALVEELNQGGLIGYLQKQTGLSSTAPVKFVKEPPTPTPTGPATIPASSATEADFAKAWELLDADAKKKAGKALASVKHNAKKKGDPALYFKYDQMTAFDYWKSKQTEITVPGGGQTVNVPPPVKNPPNDPAKLAKIQQLEADYKAAKPTGTGFNPVKGFGKTLNPPLNLTDPLALKTFDNEIGVGYLTADQLEQALTKANTPALTTKMYLSKYADAKGQAAADAIQDTLSAKFSAAGSPSSAGASPSYSQSYGFDPAAVPIKPGTQYTVDRTNKDKIKNKSAVPNPAAPLGTSDNPHQFVMSDQNDYKTFGSMLTEQDINKWSPGYVTGVQTAKKYTGSWYSTINDAIRSGDTSNSKVASFDKAFHAPEVKPTEEWMIITRGTGRREFNNNELGIKLTSSSHASPDDFQHLVGKTYTTDAYYSSSITAEPGYGKTVVRVIGRIPPGSRLMYADGQPNHGAYISTNMGEREVIGPRGMVWKVLEVKKSDLSPYQVDVIAELVEQPI